MRLETGDFDPRLPGLVHRLSIDESAMSARAAQTSQPALLAIQLDLNALRSRRAALPRQPLFQRHRRAGLSGRRRDR